MLGVVSFIILGDGLQKCYIAARETFSPFFLLDGWETETHLFTESAALLWLWVIMRCI